MGKLEGESKGLRLTSMFTRPGLNGCHHLANRFHTFPLINFVSLLYSEPTGNILQDVFWLRLDLWCRAHRLVKYWLIHFKRFL